MEGGMPATINDVAASAGVSVATASRALNGKAGVKPETRQRVLAAAQALRYAANGAARGLVTARTGTIGVLQHRSRPSEDVYPFYWAIIHAVEAELDRLGYHLLIATATDDRLKDAASLGLVSENRVDGLVLIGPDFPARFVLQLKQLGLPVLLVDHALDAVPIDSVRNDDRQGGRLATQHLIGHGHRTVAALLGPEAWPSSALRGAGYREAVAAAGLAPHLFRGPDTTPETGEALTRQALIDLPQLSAIFTANDAMAFGALRALAALGRRVPEEVALVGFDDVTAAAFCHPPLSTVRVFKSEMGKQVARRVVELAGEPGPAVQILLATELVARRSCGCEPTASPAVARP
jgi:DNA-binding LacI/PurR family transcriptional regulator